MSTLPATHDPRHRVPLYREQTLTPERLLKHLSSKSYIFKMVPLEFHRHLPMLVGSVLLDRDRKLTCFRALTADIDFRNIGLKPFLLKLAEEHYVVTQCLNHAMLNEMKTAQSP